MKKLIIENDLHNTSVEVTAKKIYETDFGKWVAEVDVSDLQHACEVLCPSKDCDCGGMRGEAAEDDDGKEYRLVGI